MKTLATTRMSSKGQVVIPESVRRDLNLRTGEQFVVVGQGDVVILKTLSAPDRTQFNGLVAKARKSARQVGLKKTHRKQAIRRARERS